VDLPIRRSGAMFALWHWPIMQRFYYLDNNNNNNNNMQATNK
jgi:hypothetical protein